ncbi:MAG: hypothetical protein ABIL22_04580 [candidate division WOR-3 bacterium]
MLERNSIISAFTNQLQPLDYVLAFWEAGSTAFARNDQWSDLDFYIVVEDEYVEKAGEQLALILDKLGGYDLVFQLPEPTWHGHFQIFYRLKNASPFLFLDIVIMKESSPDKFLQYAVHGQPVVFFDKKGIVKDDPVNPDILLEKLKKRLEYLKTTFELFKVLTLKELNRNKPVLAYPYYFSMTLRPLVEVLRIKYAPFHYNFFTAYIDHDLPSDIYQKLKRFFFVAEEKKLRQAHADAVKWFEEVVNQIDFAEVRKKLIKSN